MLIGFDSKRAFYNRSGLGNYSRSTIELLSKYKPDNKYILYTPKITNSIQFIDNENVTTVIPDGFLRKKLSSYWRSFSLGKTIRKDKIDVYHGLSNELPKDIQKSGAKLVVTIHDLIFLRFPELYKYIDRKIYYNKFKFSCDAADKIIAISEQTKADIINYFNINENKIDVVYQGCSPIFYNKIDIEKRNNILSEYKLPKKYILYVGTIEERKNVLSVIKALHMGGIDIPLVILGKPSPYYEKIKEYISKHNMDKQVSIFHSMPFKHFPEIYQSALLMIYPSIFEGFGIPILESLNSGTPVITSKGGCFSETGGNSAYYVNPLDIHEISEAIKKVAKDEKLRRKMISSGYEHAAKFREESIADNLMNVYLKL